MKIACAHCGKAADLPKGHVKRSRALGMRLFCGRRCMGLAKRKHKTKAQRVEEKRLYDAAYRVKNLERIKADKRAYFARTYDPTKARIERKKKMARHVEYCRRPEYKKYKREYDRQYRAKEYSPFAEAFMLAVDLNREIKSRSSNYEIRRQNGTFGKRQARAHAEADRAQRDRNRSAQGIRLA